MDGCSEIGGQQPATVPGDELQPDQGPQIGAYLVGVEAVCDHGFRDAPTATGVRQGGGYQMRKQLPLRVSEVYVGQGTRGVHATMPSTRH